MGNKRDDILGIILGAGIVAAGGIASAAAIVRGGKADSTDWYYGIIHGYNTYPGDLYDIYREVDKDSFELIGQANGIWFEETFDNYKFLYDSVRKYGGLPVAGALVAVGQAQKAGVHSTGKREPLKGFNFWGMTAAKKYREGGGFFYVAESDRKYRVYKSIQEAVKHWLSVMRNLYPISYEELFSRTPDIEKYVYGLEHGVPYTDGKERQYAPGVTDFYEVITSTVDRVVEQLHDNFGYNFSI